MGLFKKNKKSAGSVNAEPRSNELNKEKGVFHGFALLSEPKWSKTQFVADMKEEWDIDLSNGLGDDGKIPSEDTLVYAEYNGMRVITGLVDAPVPNREAEQFAMANYMWKDAVAETEKHKAHLILSVMGDGDAMEKAKLFVKTASAALKQDTVLGLYYNGAAVFQPSMYRECAEMMRTGDIPLLNLVWFGLFSDGKQAGVHTYGMRQFGKEEIEVYVPSDKADLNALRQFVCGTAMYVLKENAVLRDGETIGFSAEQKLPITVSPALAFSGNSIKIDVLAQ